MDGKRFIQRPKWSPAKGTDEAIPTPLCPVCGKSIGDLASAFCDRNSGEAIHFDCALNIVTKREQLDHGDTLSYIGGGRFGVVHFDRGPGAKGRFRIKKVIESDKKDERSDWRRIIADHFSVT
jgi:hypothetical protein